MLCEFFGMPDLEGLEHDTGLNDLFEHSHSDLNGLNAANALNALNASSVGPTSSLASGGAPRLTNELSPCGSEASRWWPADEEPVLRQSLSQSLRQLRRR